MVETALSSSHSSSSQHADISTRDSLVESDLVTDYSSEFTTYEVFKSREALCKWAREAGKKNGFVIVVNKSDVTSKGRRPRIMLGCERGGNYRSKNKNIEADSKKRKRETGTKKCGCPFSLKGVKLPTEDEWMLAVLCGVHNHPATEHFKGHSYAGRLSQQETSLLVDMSKSMVRPKDILVTLKEKDALNASTMRTIYNARQKYKVAEKAGRSQMQYLLDKLAEYKYITWHRSTNATETAMDLFWAHPCSVDLLRTFPHVLIMDCTYKTNKYCLPLFEIVGVTSTELTFSVAFVYLQSKQEENYTWALRILRSIMEDHCVMPNVIVTDRELGLMNAIPKVFPTTRHLLCRWHISKNVIAKCKEMFESQEKFDKFIGYWNVLVLSSTSTEYHEHLATLQREFSTYPEPLQYVSTTWLTPYSDRFVAAWTDTCMHFGNVTLNRTENAHARLKQQFGPSQLNFESSWTQIHSLIELQHTKIKASFQKSLITAQHKFKGTEFKDLRGVVSISALENVLAQLRRSNSVGINASACGCTNRQTHGLPCAHEVAGYQTEGRPIPLDCIDPHWRKLDMKVPPKEPEPVESFQEVVDLFMKRFNEEDTETQLEMLTKLRQITRSFSTPLAAAEAKPKTQGRSKNKIDTSTHRDSSASELALSRQDSYSPGPTIVAIAPTSSLS